MMADAVKYQANNGNSLKIYLCLHVQCTVLLLPYKILTALIEISAIQECVMSTSTLNEKVYYTKVNPFSSIWKWTFSSQVLKSSGFWKSWILLLKMRITFYISFHWIIKWIRNVDTKINNFPVEIICLFFFHFLHTNTKTEDKSHEKSIFVVSFYVFRNIS